MFRDIQNFLRLGQLRLERTYSGDEKATGVLDIDQVNDHFFQCHEYGTMILPTGYEGDFSKKFSLRFEGEIIKIYCDHATEGVYQFITPFLKDDEWIASGIHHCIDDIYKTDYAFSMARGFSVVHTVAGPKKNYISTSIYSKEDNS